MDDSVMGPKEDARSKVVDPEKLKLLSIEKMQNDAYFRDSVIRIPKPITSLDEAYIRRCLEFIHINALNSNTDFFSDRLTSNVIMCGSRFDNALVIASHEENVFIGSADDSLLGSLTRSTSVMNVLKRPLFRQFGELDCDAKFNGNSIDFRDPMSSSAVINSSPGGFSIGASQKLPKEKLFLEDKKLKCESMHKRLVSISSTNSAFSDHSVSSSTASSGFCQGLLHCTWNDSGFPKYMFSVNDQREIYAAHLSKFESAEENAPDFVYTFHSKDGKRLNKICDKDSAPVGRMRISTSFSLCPNLREVRETRFILFGSTNGSAGDTQNSNDCARKKSKGLSKKMALAFKSRHSYRQRASSKCEGISEIQEDLGELFHRSYINFAVNNAFPNLELAAIIMKDHTDEHHHEEEEIGGWGLKFLKKLGNEQKNSSSEPLLPCEYCKQSAGGCSTSTDIVIPAGIHGGPRTKNGGPSSLIDRWRRGGNCDCGGWDIGCPISLLKPQPANRNSLFEVDVCGEGSTLDLFVQGSKQSVPMVKMVNVHDGLYYIHFQTSLSALQSLAIAVAIIHSRGPSPPAKVCTEGEVVR